MNVAHREVEGLLGTSRFLFLTRNDSVAQRLGAALRSDGVVMQEEAVPAQLATRLTELTPQVVFLDFGADEAYPDELLQATECARMLARTQPGLPVVAVGSLSRPQGTLAALRAGVRDFIDSENQAEVQDVVRRVLQNRGADLPSASSSRGQLIVLLGVRAGVGASTLGAHLSSLAQLVANAESSVDAASKPTTASALKGSTALLDLGLPVCDGQLYLNASGNFHFAEAVRNLRRFDETLVNTALSRSESGVTVISLPRDLTEMRTVSHGDSLALLDKLRDHFGLLLADVGGFTNADFVAGLVRAADQTWLVTDQSVGSLVSLADVLRDLNDAGIDRSRLHLLVNRYDERYGMTAEQIAARFETPLLATLPDRTLALMSSTNQGRLLHEVSERDPYVKALRVLLDTLGAAAGSSHDKNWLSRWLPGLHKRLMLR